MVITNVGHLSLVRDSLAEADVSAEVVIAEPVGRNTAPATIAAALWSDPDDLLVILPSDHLIRDGAIFAEIVTESARFAEAGYLVAFGILPTRADTGYGYLEKGEDLGGAFVVQRFTEKPDEESARSMIDDGLVWNSGMFVMRAGTLLAEAAEHCPRILDGVSAAMSAPEDGVLSLLPAFAEVEPVPIDIAIMEKTSLAVVVPIDVGWSDIGSYEALWEALERDQSGNAHSGEALLVEVSGSLVKATARMVAVAGLDDIVVVETEDAVIVVPRHRSQLVRDLVAELGSASRPEV